VLRDLILWLFWTDLTQGKLGYCTDSGYSMLTDHVLFAPETLQEPDEFHLVELSEHLSWGQGF